MTAKRAVLMISLLSVFGPASVEAQLRPYEPFAWEVYDGSNWLTAGVGATFLGGQRASLAGTEGQLVEAGTLEATARTGRVALSARGTVRRFFRESDTFAAPATGVEPAPDRRRSDSGDYLVETAVALTPPNRPAMAVLRFGTRLPTTDNRVGLERDQTDFFALLAGRFDHGHLRGTAELGVGIHGTRDPAFEQSDVLVFVLGTELTSGRLRPQLLLVGHADGLANRAIRGNEELAELRMRVRGGDMTWVEVEVARGLTDYSPDYGVSISVGVRR